MLETSRERGLTSEPRWSTSINETGMRIHVSLLLEANHVVVVKCQAVGVVPNGKANARVVDCRALMGSGYTSGQPGRS
jgi:hypothetical protein